MAPEVVPMGITYGAKHGENSALIQRWEPN